MVAPICRHLLQAVALLLLVSSCASIGPSAADSTADSTADSDGSDLGTSGPAARARALELLAWLPHDADVYLAGAPSLFLEHAAELFPAYADVLPLLHRVERAALSNGDQFVVAAYVPRGTGLIGLASGFTDQLRRVPRESHGANYDVYEIRSGFYLSVPQPGTVLLTSVLPTDIRADAPIFPAPTREALTAAAIALYLPSPAAALNALSPRTLPRGIGALTLRADLASAPQRAYIAAERYLAGMNDSAASGAAVVGEVTRQGPVLSFSGQLAIADTAGAGSSVMRSVRASLRLILGNLLLRAGADLSRLSRYAVLESRAAGTDAALVLEGLALSSAELVTLWNTISADVQ